MVIPHHMATQSYQEDGKTGKIFKPRALNIVWGKDPRYWNVPETDNDKPAELLQVCWLEVTGCTDIDLRKEYEVTFHLSLTPDAFGWSGCPVYVMAKCGTSGKFSSKRHQLTSFNNISDIPISCRLKTPESAGDRKLYFGLYEVWSGRWKGGLRIHKVTVKEVTGN